MAAKTLVGGSPPRRCAGGNPRRVRRRRPLRQRDRPEDDQSRSPCLASARRLRAALPRLAILSQRTVELAPWGESSGRCSEGTSTRIRTHPAIGAAAQASLAAVARGIPVLRTLDAALFHPQRLFRPVTPRPRHRSVQRARGGRLLLRGQSPLLLRSYGHESLMAHWLSSLASMRRWIAGPKTMVLVGTDVRPLSSLPVAHDAGAGGGWGIHGPPDRANPSLVRSPFSGSRNRVALIAVLNLAGYLPRGADWRQKGMATSR